MPTEAVWLTPRALLTHTRTHAHACSHTGAHELAHAHTRTRTRTGEGRRLRRLPPRGHVCLPPLPCLGFARPPREQLLELKAHSHLPRRAGGTQGQAGKSHHGCHQTLLEAGPRLCSLGDLPDDGAATETSGSLLPAARGARPRVCWAPGSGWTLGTGGEQQGLLKPPARNAHSRHCGHTCGKEWPGRRPAHAWQRRPGAEPASQLLSPPGGPPSARSGWRAGSPDLSALQLEAASRVSSPDELVRLPQERVERLAGPLPLGRHRRHREGSHALRTGPRP